MAALWVHIEKSYKNQQMCDIAKRVANTILPAKIKSGKESGYGMAFRKEPDPDPLLELKNNVIQKYFLTMEIKHYGGIQSCDIVLCKFNAKMQSKMTCFMI